MIVGEVTSSREIIFPIQVRDHSGEWQEVRAVLDTGFSRALTLPPMLIEAFGLTPEETAIARLADGTLRSIPQYTATVLWDGNEREVIIYAADTNALIGMGMLYGFDLHVHVLDGGVATAIAL